MEKSNIDKEGYTKKYDVVTLKINYFRSTDKVF